MLAWLNDNFVAWFRPRLKLSICSSTEWNGYQLPHPVLMTLSLLVIVVAMRDDGGILIASAKLCLYGTRPSCVTVRYGSSKYLLHYVMASVYALWVSLSVNYVT